MKTNKSGVLNLREGGKDDFEDSEAFVKQASAIRKEITGKYAPLLIQQKSWLKRFYTWLKREIEIRKRIRQLSSWKNLHANSQHVFRLGSVRWIIVTPR